MKELQVREGKEELKQEFIELRAKGVSYDKITKKLKVSKGTLTEWNKELSVEITRLKAVELDTLYETYYLTKEARIRRIGGILRSLETEAEKRDLSEVRTDKLLELILKYRETLKDEFIDLQETRTITELNGQEILEELVSLYNKLKTGEIAKEQAYKENFILMSILKAYEATTLEKKFDKLQALLEER